MLNEEAIKEGLFQYAVPSQSPDVCWLWKGPTRRGYGRFTIAGKTYVAHKVSFFLANGREAQKMLRHTCDNGSCCNPRHLIEGTHAENMADRRERDRTAKGERIASAVLTVQKVQEIREHHRGGLGYGLIAKAFGVDKSTIAHIIQGKSWRHVT